VTSRSKHRGADGVQVIDFLKLAQERELYPLVTFAFNRLQCESLMMTAWAEKEQSGKLDFTSDEEKVQIEEVCTAHALPEHRLRAAHALPAHRLRAAHALPEYQQSANKSGTVYVAAATLCTAFLVATGALILYDDRDKQGGPYHSDRETDGVQPDTRRGQ
jgi:hypothetical protein